MSRLVGDQVVCRHSGMSTVAQPCPDTSPTGRNAKFQMRLAEGHGNTSGIGLARHESRGFVGLGLHRAPISGVSTCRESRQSCGSAQHAPFEGAYNHYLLTPPFSARDVRQKAQIAGTHDVPRVDAQWSHGLTRISFGISGLIKVGGSQVSSSHVSNPEVSTKHLVPNWAPNAAQWKCCTPQ